jgi:hypothetical protein
MALSPVKISLLKKLQSLENKWSQDYLELGTCTVEMLKTESDIKSVRNSIKYQDVQENLQVAANA